MLISRICDEFKIDPWTAAAGLDSDDEEIALDIIDVRQYARCKNAYDTAKGPDDSRLDDWQESDVLVEVKANTRALFLERTKGIKAEWRSTSEPSKPSSDSETS